jgi:hypothetical protein
MRPATIVSVLMTVACIGDDPATTPSSGGGSGSIAVSDDFEDGCGGWDSSSADLTADSTARSGTKSCRACFKGTEAAYDVFTRHSLVLKPGDRFLVSAWIRQTADKPPAQSMLLGVRVEDAEEATLEEAAGTAPGLTDSWQEVTASVEVTKSTATALRVLVASQLVADATLGSCFLVDDLTITRQ